MMLLPPPPDVCPVCAVKHEAWQAHNAQSLYYQMRFQGLHGRWPTWADAAAHCSDEVRAHWKQMLSDRGAWSEPPTGVLVIAEPLAESLRGLVDVGTSEVVAIDDGVSR